METLFENLRVVLVSTRNPLNIGAAARALHNFGFKHLRLVNPYEVAFEEARSAVHAVDILQNAQVYSSLSEAVSDCTLVVGTTALRRRELQHTVRGIEYGGRILRRHLNNQPAALLFGSEKYGLSNEDLSYCHWLANIGTHDSMNLGQAVAVCLYELTRRASPLRAETRRLATSEDLDRFTGIVTEVLMSSGYVHATSTAAKLRRLIRRLRLTAHDIEVWLGIFRQIQWKLSQDRE